MTGNVRVAIHGLNSAGWRNEASQGDACSGLLTHTARITSSLASSMESGISPAARPIISTSRKRVLGYVLSKHKSFYYPRGTLPIANIIMTRSPTELDHVVILLPYQDILEPPEWITKNFVVSPGGRHADGKTENRLILFGDGTYIELIAFINDDPEKRKGHWWDSDFGVVDFALTTAHGKFDYAALQSRLRESGSEISYAKPSEGGRITPDKRELKWKVTFPQNVKRGVVPFWCHDLTPREYRVPIDNVNTHHPGGALGMAGVVVEVADDQVGRINDALYAITETRQENGMHAVGTPFDVGNLEKPTIQVKTLDEKARKELHLTLLLQHPGEDRLRDIDYKAGDGTVSIHYVK